MTKKVNISEKLFSIQYACYFIILTIYINDMTYYYYTIFAYLLILL